MSSERPHHNRTLGILAVGAMAFALLQTMVAPALPAIQAELGASTTAVTWTLTAYLLSASIATPILGRLGDIFGKERMLVTVLFADHRAHVRGTRERLSGAASAVQASATRSDPRGNGIRERPRHRRDGRHPPPP